MIRFIIKLGLLLFVTTTCAFEHQGVISGQLLDAKTKAPLPYANIFLAGTTLGSSTDSDGNFTINKIPIGSYNLVFSYIGYRTKTIPVNITFQNLKHNFSVKLFVDPLVGKEITVESTLDRDWYKNLRRFKNEFLGRSRFASKCKIVNPEVINITYNSRTGKLLAHTDQKITVINNYLGYKIELYLKEFEWTVSKSGSYIIWPHFIELGDKNHEDYAKWEKNRNEVFTNSKRHFFSSMAMGSLKKDGFTMYEIETDPVKAKFMGKNFALEFPPDSLNLTTLHDFPIVKRLYLEEPLRIHNKTTEDSKIHIRTTISDYVDIDMYGNYQPVQALVFSGHWAQERLTEMLPFNYWPE